MVRAVKIGLTLMTLSYIALVVYIYIEINLRQNEACGIPPIKGCIERHDINYAPTPEPEEMVVSSF